MDPTHLTKHSENKPLFLWRGFTAASEMLFNSEALYGPAMSAVPDVPDVRCHAQGKSGHDPALRPLTTLLPSGHCYMLVMVIVIANLTP